MIVSDSSPLIAIGRIGRLDLFGELFGKIVIPTSVYQETVVETKLRQQRDAILQAIEAGIIKVVQPQSKRIYRRRLGAGERGVLDLAIEVQASRIILDDKKARREANEVGLKLLFTTDILRGAERRGLISSYEDIMAELQALSIYLPA